MLESPAAAAASHPARFPRPGGGGGRVAPPSRAAGGAARHRPPGSGAAVTRGARTEPRPPAPVSGQRAAGAEGYRGPSSQPRRALPSPASLPARSGWSGGGSEGGSLVSSDGLRGGTGRGRARGVPPSLGVPAGAAGPGSARVGSAGPSPPVGPLVVRPLPDNGAAIRKGAEPQVPHPRPAAAPSGAGAFGNAPEVLPRREVGRLGGGRCRPGERRFPELLLVEK